MAMVYLANDLRLERKVAVKVMHEHLAEDENFTRRFDREARSAARLSHANLVNVFDQGHDLGRTYLVMEYLPSITLRQLLKQQKRLTLDQALEIAEAILSGLAAAHSAGIVHRDLKPENVLLVDDGRIKIGDFGLARAVSANTTTGQALLGTIAYLSPELVTRGIADERSDIYAFGIMLFEMLSGEQPFKGEQPMQIAYQHANSEVPAPSELADVSTPAVDEFVLWLTRRDPDARPDDASDALVHLREILKDPYSVPAALATRVLAHEDLPAEEPLAHTTVLPDAMLDDDVFVDDATTHLTPSTSVLEPLPQSGAPESGAAVATAKKSGVDRARDRGRKRAKRGKIVATLLALLIIAVAGVGWSFGQGPWSQVTVPEVAGLTLDDAQAELERHALTVTFAECSSLEVEAGYVTGTEPEAGTRLDRGSSVEVCESTGPQMLPVPTLVGLSLEDAKKEIEQAGFTFGEVVDPRFSASDPADTVILALDQDGNSLGEVLPEQGVIDLIVSLGALPDVRGMTVEDATRVLGNVDLTIDASRMSEAHHEDIAEGRVLGLNPASDTVRPGDGIGLQISLGPELFAVPDIAGMPLQDAMDTLAAAGFEPVTGFPAPLRSLAVAERTEPAAGTMLPHGSEIRVIGALSL